MDKKKPTANYSRPNHPLTRTMSKERHGSFTESDREDNGYYTGTRKRGDKTGRLTCGQKGQNMWRARTNPEEI